MRAILNTTGGMLTIDLVRVNVGLRRENVRPWHEVESDFLESDYQDVRERQMKELEEEDDLLSKVPVRCVFGHIHIVSC